MERSRVTADVTLPREPKQERSRRKQEALLQAAEELFATRGFEDVTADDIAAHTGHGTGTFYNYFANKTQAFLMVAGRHEAALAPTVEDLQQAVGQGADLQELLGRVVHRVIDARAEVPWLRRTWLRLALTDADVEKLQRRLDEDWDSALTAIIRSTRGAAAGSTAPAQLGTTVRVMVNALADEVVVRETMSPEDAAHAAGTVIAGLLAGEETRTG